MEADPLILRVYILPNVRQMGQLITRKFGDRKLSALCVVSTRGPAAVIGWV